MLRIIAGYFAPNFCRLASRRQHLNAVVHRVRDAEQLATI